MARKLITLVSVSVLSGLVATASASGCSANEVTGPQSQVTDAKVDRHIGDSEEPTNSCMTTQAIGYATAPYKSPIITPNACPDTVFTFIHDYIQNAAKPSYDELHTKLTAFNADCASCIFGLDGDKWPPIVVDGSGMVSELNVGSCMEIVSGKFQCGQGYQRLAACLSTGCNDCQAEADYRACLGAIVDTGAPCAGALDDFVTACGSSYKTYLDHCFLQNDDLDVYASIRAQCVTGASDAGSDASDASDAD